MTGVRSRPDFLATSALESDLEFFQFGGFRVQFDGAGEKRVQTVAYMASATAGLPTRKGPQ